MSEIPTEVFEETLSACREHAAYREVSAWLRKHRPAREGGTGLSTRAWMDLLALFRQRMDLSWLAGVSYGRSAEREKIAKALEAAITNPCRYERDIYVNDGLRDAARIARGEDPRG